MIKKRLPHHIQFTLDNLHDPGSMEFMINISVYLKDSTDEESQPIVYAVILSFLKNDQEDLYQFADLQLDCCYHVDPFDAPKLEALLKVRLMELLEPCSINIRLPVQQQLQSFLQVYGTGNQARFIL